MIPVNEYTTISGIGVIHSICYAVRVDSNAPIKEAQATMTTANPVLELSESNFDEIISGGKPVLVEFSAPWCATCQSMRPIFDDMAVNNGQVLFARINVDNNQALAMSYDIQQIPTYMMFVDGMSVDRKMGPIDEYGLEQWVLYHLGR